MENVDQELILKMGLKLRTYITYTQFSTTTVSGTYILSHHIIYYIRGVDTHCVKHLLDGWKSQNICKYNL